jgi:signal transduction histidine kinase
LPASLARSAGPKVEVELDVGHDTWPVVADIAQAGTAVLNLVINAREAMPEGGRLVISTTNVRLRGERDGLAGDYVALMVADTGTGMPAEVAARAFEPFVTTKRRGGSGVGLSQVYGFATQCRGTATIESVPGAATDVTLYLPRGGRPAGANAPSL